jgi:hypothetical protein
MAIADTAEINNEENSVLSWEEQARTFFERVPVPFPAALAIITLLVLGEQILEDALLGSLAPSPAWQQFSVRLVLPVLSAYLLLSNRGLKRAVLDCLVRLQPSVQVSAERYGQLVEKMIRPSRKIEMLLLAISSAVVLSLYAWMDNPLPIYNLLGLPANSLEAGLILVTYILIGWLGLSLVYTSIQHAYYLSKLARYPLNINVFDPENLLPFGSISLLHSLVLAGVVVILRVLLGRPTSPASFLVIILASIGSLLALVLPLTGVYQQMRQAKIKALNNISDQLLQAQEVLLSLTNPLDDGVTELNARTNALVNLRRTILDSPNWPFRSNTAVARAVIAAMSPLIYFVLTELVRVYIVPFLID